MEPGVTAKKRWLFFIDFLIDFDLFKYPHYIIQYLVYYFRVKASYFMSSDVLVVQ